MTEGEVDLQRLAIDVGGTFTDIVYRGRGGVIHGKKIPSKTAADTLLVEQGLLSLSKEHSDVDYRAMTAVIHGATVATNAILEKKGARTGLITTKGFRDVLELRRIRYPDGFNPFWVKPEPLVPRFLRREVTERLDANGEVLIPLDIEEVRRIVRDLRREEVTSLAVCLLHSYANRVHEVAIRDLVEREFPDILLSASHDTSALAGEYERTSTAVADAYVKPAMTAYLREMQSQLRSVGIRAPLFVMQSNGLMDTASLAMQHPVFTLESGPASGVLACEALARELEAPKLLSLDMGGTTAKAASIENGQALRTTEYEVGGSMSVASRLVKGGGYLIRVRAIDIAEVGAGGGSIVGVGAGGMIQVGPQSAGAYPGPVCYDQGGQDPTVTDVDLILGYLNPRALLGGSLPVNKERAVEVFKAKVAGPAGMDVLECAYGAYLVANANMGRAVRAVTSERGRDVREYTLVAYGGAAPVHAAELARSLDIRRVIVPVMPGLFSAVGLLAAPEAHEFGRTTLRLLQNHTPEEWEDLFQRFEGDVARWLQQERVGQEHLSFVRRADLRYAGQFHELTVEVPERPLTRQSLQRLEQRFHEEHSRTYGHHTDEPMEVVNLWVEARTGAPIPPFGAVLSAAGQRYTRSGTKETRRAYFGPEAGLSDTPVLKRADLGVRGAGGPCIIEEYDTTIVVPPDFQVRRDRLGNVVLQAA